MKKIRILNFNLVSFAGMVAIFYAFLGIFYGFILMIFVTVAKNIPGATAGFQIGKAIGALSIIFMPIMFAVIGFIGGIIFGLILNITLKIINGLELEIKEEA